MPRKTAYRLQPTAYCSPFGPWATALDSRSADELSTFWKRRMAMIPYLTSSTQHVSRRIVLALVIVALAAVAAPTVYLVSGTHAQAGDRPDASVAADKPARQPEFLPPLSASEERILAALEEPTELELDGTSLHDLADFIRRKHNIAVQIDTKALEELSLDSQTTNFTNSIKGIKLRSALRLLLKRYDLTYLIQNEVLNITSETEAEEDFITRTYPVGDLVGEGGDADYAALAKAIATTISPDTWLHGPREGSARATAPNRSKPAVLMASQLGLAARPSPALGSIAVVNASKSLVITQTHDVHDKVLTLLRSLRKARGLGVPDRAPAAPATPKSTPAPTPAPAKSSEAAPAKPSGDDPFR